MLPLCFSDTISPLITVETCGEKKFTAAKDGIACGSTAASHWKEHLFFEPRNIVSFRPNALRVLKLQSDSRGF